MTVAPGGNAPTMKRPAWVRLESGRYALAIVIAEAAQDSPGNSGGIHRAPSMVELLTKVSIHATNHVVFKRHAQPFCGRSILPCEIAVTVLLGRRSPVDVPQILIDISPGIIGDGEPSAWRITLSKNGRLGSDRDGWQVAALFGTHSTLLGIWARGANWRFCRRLDRGVRCERGLIDPRRR